MVSVALTTYNGEKYILQQLQSILDQNIPVDEVIICDDGSTDSTAKIIQQFICENKLSEWKFAENQKNLGYSKNFFKAVGMCQGNYIFLCDQDDIWPSDKVEKILKIFEEDKEIYAVSSNYSVINAKGEVINTPHLNRKKVDLTIEEVVGSSNIKGCTMCIRKELDDLIVHEDIAVGRQLGHDWYYNFLACLMGRNVVIPDTLLLYRVHGENISLKRNKRKMLLATNRENRIAIFDEMLLATNTVVKRVEEIQQIENEKKQKINKMLHFCRIRRKFVAGQYSVFWELMSMHKYYNLVGVGKKGAIHALISDILYATGINMRFGWR